MFSTIGSGVMTRSADLPGVGASLLALLASLVCAGQASAGGAFDAAVFEAQAARLHQESGVPGMAVAVLEDGEILHVGGYGIAGPDGRPVTGRTAFQAGSITKSFVALVVLQLAAEDRLVLDDPVTRFLPSFRTADKAQSDRITIEHLVTHRSGLSTLDGNTAQPVAAVLSGPEAAVAGLAGVQLLAEPGTVFEYSNANYAVLSHLIEVLEGQLFERVLEKRILDPLGMENSFVAAPHSGSIDVATGYRLWFGIPRPWQPQPAPVPDRRMIGAGSVWASIEDLSRYVEAVRSRDARVVPDSADRLFAIYPFHEPWGYGYGWFTDSSGGEPVFEHSGFTPGFLSLASIVPASSQVVVVLTNMSGLAHGGLPRAVTHAALDREPLPAKATFTARTAIWSAVAAPLGLMLLIFKAWRRLRHRGQAMSVSERVLNSAAAVALLLGVYAVYFGYQLLVGVSFPTGHAFYPDLTATVVAAMYLAVILAGCRLALAVRGD